MRKDELSGHEIKSIYLGGGTPSVLSAEELNLLFEQLERHYLISGVDEVSIEANPDDLSYTYLKDLKSKTLVNRLSIGVQSFHEADLKWMNRSHNAKQSLQCLKDAQEAGFENISIDLIYGIPTKFGGRFEDNLNQFFELEIPHLSAYDLTVEQGTALHHMVHEKREVKLSSGQSENEMRYLIAAAGENDFIHYEISNFGKEGYFAVHNSSYWKGIPYLGLGPSAHSFDGASTRKWNIRNNMKYIKSIQDGKTCYEKEELSEKDRYNEYILTGIRTVWGVDAAYVKEVFKPEINAYFEKQMQSMKHVFHSVGKTFRLNNEGKLMADQIASNLFYV